MAIQETQRSMLRWHSMINTKDISILNDLLHENVIFKSPAAFSPYPGKMVVTLILSNVIEIFENFTYHREFYSSDGLNVVLEFSANIGEKKLKGVDIIQFNQEGQIIDFEVMIRPKSGLEILAAQMSQRMAQFLPK